MKVGENNENCGIVLLAAGESSRMGRPKQLLRFEGKSLLGHAVQVALDTVQEPVIVVLGANAPLFLPELDKQPVHTVLNPDWTEGMASSIRLGLSALLERDSSVDAAVFMVCDQPFMSSALLKELIAKRKDTGKAIIASTYGNTAGTPAVFNKSIFPELLALAGDTGARKLIRQHPDLLATVPFLLGNIDIDTPQDYEALRKNRPGNR